ncbi:Ppx/GppA phosphatase family protein [Agrobacterium sp. ES01]|uniref:Ppx/GppA phosphatase family protein n=1 Tax=Agrobacterium sp. ES01 TaxID=3420714 RepID=UPI003D0B4723
MTDPDRGPVPQVEGASAEKRAKGQSRRRKKAKRKGAMPPAAQPHSVENRAQAPDSSGRSEAGDHRASRKRKRRRKGGAAKLNPSSTEGQAQSAATAPAHGDTSKPEQSPGKKRRRSRNRKNRHVRPLAPAGVSQTSARSGDVAVKETPQAPDRAEPPARRPSSQTAAPFQSDQDLYAALDLGTNNCRLLIAAPTRPGQFRVVDAFSRIVRLGEGLGTSSRLSDEAMDRSVEALKICAGKLAGRPIRRMRLIATEACRAAENGELFLTRVTEETGLELEIINRETEARLAVSGCSSLVGREARSVVLFDIGGGSSEIAVIRIGDNRSSRLANHITHWTSLPVGVVTLSERHGGRDVTPTVFEAMVSEVAGMLGKFESPSPQDDPHHASGFHLIGTSGTVTTLAGVHLDLPRYDRRRVDGLWLSDDEVSAMQAKLLSWDYAGRAANPCIGPDRADLVLAGSAILEAIRRRWPSTRMRVADRGLREGLLTDMMADDGVWRRNRHRVRQFREREH